MNQHYSGNNLVETIQSALALAEVMIEEVTVDDLGPIDEFHTGGRVATSHLLQQVDLQPGQKVLDIGCGIGGTGRFIAERYAVDVSGIDLSAEYIETARVLNDWVSLSDRIGMKVGNATTLPYKDGEFDVVIMLHVGMNVSDKPSLFSEVCRVLRPGGHFLIYDVMIIKDAEFDFPVPWAADALMNHMESSGTYVDLLESAGLTVQKVEGRSDFAKAFFTRVKAKTASSKVRSPLGLHLLMGEDIGEKTSNFAKAVFADVLEPAEIISVK